MASYKKWGESNIMHVSRLIYIFVPNAQLERHSWR